MPSRSTDHAFGYGTVLVISHSMAHAQRNPQNCSLLFFAHLLPFPRSARHSMPASFSLPLLLWLLLFLGSHGWLLPPSFSVGDSVTLVQISDLHTRDRHPEDGARLERFVATVLPQLRPHRVLVTGDVVMGYKTRFFSKSVEEQWKRYRQLWAAQSTVSREHWLDVPGNHDYTMKQLTDHGTDYDAYAAQSSEHGVSFTLVETESSRLCLVGVDTSYTPRLITFLECDCRHAVLAQSLRLAFSLSTHARGSTNAEEQLLARSRLRSHPTRPPQHPFCAEGVPRGIHSLLSQRTPSRLARRLPRPLCIPFSRVVSLRLHVRPGASLSGVHWKVGFSPRLSRSYRVLVLRDNWLSFTDRSLHDALEPFLLFLSPPVPFAPGPHV
mgnify:FL=1